MFLNQKKKRRYAPFFLVKKHFFFRKNRKNRFFEPREVDFLVCSGEVYLYINVNTAPSARFDAYSFYNMLRSYLKLMPNQVRNKKSHFCTLQTRKTEKSRFFPPKIRQNPPNAANPELQSQIFGFRGLESKNDFF